ncbi:deoxyribose-phosphate aldolase [Saccharicrinis aurantiacus]|uniref:deoxyribose-phosphate aldolase n=1 Tax=Saccharicrinis aurantiacus TaxID=1849719 RepID=UPI00094FD50E|nr:deoxyribose-phosphate aldolase [Saccharicrinis aurantiacus]
MEEIFEKYPYQLNDELIKAEIENIISSNIDLNKDVDALKTIFSCIDLTTLSPTDSVKSVTAFVEKVNQFSKEYAEMPNVAAICVFPNYADTVKTVLKVEGVNRAVVSAGFPNSQALQSIKVTETSLAIDGGANEIDVVISIGEFFEGNYKHVFDELVKLKEACGDVHLKVILETGLLNDPELIWKASMLAMEAGADFIKTSTGKVDPAATHEAAYVMSKAIKEYTAQSGRVVGLKPAGGISTTSNAVAYYSIVKEVLGTMWLNNTWFRIGASRLANELLNDILKLNGEAKETVKFF